MTRNNSGQDAFAGRSELGNVTAGNSPSCAGEDSAGLGSFHLLSPHAHVLWLPWDGGLKGQSNSLNYKGFVEMVPSGLKSQGRLSSCSVGRASMLITMSVHCSSPISSQIYSKHSNKLCSLISYGPPAMIIKKDLSQFKIHYNNHKAYQQQL